MFIWYYIDMSNHQKMQSSKPTRRGLQNTAGANLASQYAKGAAATSISWTARQKGRSGRLLMTTYSSILCNTCTRPIDNPYRRFDASGHIVEGCIDDSHTPVAGLLSKSSYEWHFSESAIKIRKATAERLSS